MNLTSFISNIFDCLKTTDGLHHAVKKLFWLYNKSGGLEKNSGNGIQINLKYPTPIGKIKLKVRNNQGSDSFIVSEVFQQQCYHISLEGDISCIMDLGANAGFTTVYFSRLFPKATIACVEPMPNNLSILRENIALNNVNCYVFEAAATIEDKKTVMETGDKDYGNKVYNIPFGKTMDKGKLIVDGLSVNTIIEKLNWQHIDLLKIDIEGYEGILLNKNNNWLSKVDTIIMELHEGVTIDFIKKTTASYGFINIKRQKDNWILSKKEIF